MDDAPAPPHVSLEPHFVVDTRHHGKGPIVFSWHPQGTCVATSGSSRVVHIFGTNGEVVDQIVPPSPSVCTALAWDRHGHTLAVSQAGSSILLLWDAHTRKVSPMETGVKDLSFLKWSRAGDELAIGTGKGTVLLYNHATGAKVIAAGRHKRKITCGEWNAGDNTLAYGSEDRQITICSAQGDIIDQVKLKCKPVDISFGDGLVSVNVEGRTLLLYSISDERDNAVELAFQAKYGGLVAYKWFEERSIMAAFSSGHVVVISTDPHEIGKEQFCTKFHTEELRDIALCPTTNVLASCGDGCVKLIDMEGWKELQTEALEKESGQLDHLSWADHGRLLSVSTRNGNLYTFVLRWHEASVEDSSCFVVPSTLAMAMRPLSPLGLFFSLLSASVLIAFTVGSVLGVSVFDVGRVWLSAYVKCLS